MAARKIRSDIEAMKHPDKETLRLTARCTGCKKTEELADAQIEEARSAGLATCSKCGGVMTVTKAEIK